MTTLKITPNLTTPEGIERARQIRRSHKGQAHFAGTGPGNKSCRECVSWQHTGRYSLDGPKPAPCRKFKELTGKPGAEVPHSAWACKYFEQKEKPPKLQRHDFGGRE